MASTVINCRLAGQDQFSDVEKWINDNLGIGWDFEFIGLEEKSDHTTNLLVRLRFYKRLDALTFLKDFAIPNGIAITKTL